MAESFTARPVPQRGAVLEGVQSMEAKDLRISVNGKIALPVRAIPHVTGWRISPDVLAKAFAKACPSPFRWLERTSTFHLVDGKPAPITPKDWDGICAAIAGLEGELKAANPDDNVGYAKWRNQSISFLPAGVLVWVAEFEADWEADTQRRRLDGVPVRDGEDHLNYTPPLTAEAKSQILEGFELMPEFDSPEYIDAFSETIFNGRAIDWRYWIHDISTISRAEAARLMCGLDPDLYEDLASRPTKNNPTQLVDRAKRIERLAASEKLSEAAPEEWYQWARNKKINMHEVFVIEAQQRARQKEKRQTGRYTLEEAASCLAESCGADMSSIVVKLIKSVHKGDLPTYRPGSKERLIYGSGEGAISIVRCFWEEVYWDDLNQWLKAEEKRLEYCFPKPELSEWTTRTRTENAKTRGSATSVPTREILAHDWPFVSTLAVAHGNLAFAGKRTNRAKRAFDLDSLREALSNSPDWIVVARDSKGSRGKAAATWNPARLAKCILDRRYANHRSLDAFIKSDFPAWYDEWQSLTETEGDASEYGAA